VGKQTHLRFLTKVMTVSKTLHPYLINTLLVCAALLVAIDPAIWLANSWLDNSYASYGVWIAPLVVGLFLFSITSQRVELTHSGVSPLTLLMLSALVRLVSQVLGVNIIGALTLVVDVYAVGKWTGLAQRKRVISPVWLSFLFLFSLPLERVLQRSVGFGLQQLSAAGACELLMLGSDSVVCNGVRILIAQQDVLVDLPCSGARVLILLLVAFAVMAALARPSRLQAVAGFAISLLSALLSNVIRIALLAYGMAHPEYIANIDVMAAPWHELIGLFTTAIGMLPLLCWWRFCMRSKSEAPPGPPKQKRIHTRPLKYQYTGALVLLMISIIAVTLKPQPIDVAKGVTKPELPVWLSDQTGIPLPSTAREANYFERYGGHAVRANYGEHTLTMVRTSAPLRHLHAPDECLRGSGHSVRYLGIARDVIPSAIYRSVDEKGQQWRVAVTFVSATGEVTTSVAHVVWLWFQRPSSHWTMLQRAAPWSSDLLPAHTFDSAIARAFDIPHPGRETMEAFIQSIKKV